MPQSCNSPQVSISMRSSPFHSTVRSALKDPTMTPCASSGIIIHIPVIIREKFKPWFKTRFSHAKLSTQMGGAVNGERKNLKGFGNKARTEAGRRMKLILLAQALITRSAMTKIPAASCTAWRCPSANCQTREQNPPWTLLRLANLLN